VEIELESLDLGVEIITMHTTRRDLSRAPSPWDGCFVVLGDKVMIRDGKSSQVVYRSPDERASNPERLNLDRYHSTIELTSVVVNQ